MIETVEMTFDVPPLENRPVGFFSNCIARFRARCTAFWVRGFAVVPETPTMIYDEPTQKLHCRAVLKDVCDDCGKSPGKVWLAPRGGKLATFLCEACCRAGMQEVNIPSLMGTPADTPAIVEGK